MKKVIINEATITSTYKHFHFLVEPYAILYQENMQGFDGRRDDS